MAIQFRMLSGMKVHFRFLEVHIIDLQVTQPSGHMIQIAMHNKPLPSCASTLTASPPDTTSCRRNVVLLASEHKL